MARNFSLIRLFIISSALLAFTLIGTYSAQLVNPYNYTNSSTPVAVGVVSYGLSNMSALSGPYQVETYQVVGYARINSLSAYNASPPINTSQYGATVQLNVVLNVSSFTGYNYSYWIQDVLDLNTSNMTYYYIDNVWNFTGLTASLSNRTISGYGNLSESSEPNLNGTNSTINIYIYAPNATYNYTYPVVFTPAIRLDMVNDQPVVRIGYDDNGTYNYYDNVTFNIPVRTAYFLVTPYYNSPSQPGSNVTGSFYDSELVIGGEGNGEISNFSNADALLWMGYGLNNALVPFPKVGDFAADTAEAGQNLEVAQDNGYALVTTGQLNYNETLTMSGVPAALLPQSGNSSSPSTVSTVAQNATTSTLQSTATVNATTSTGSGSLSNSSSGSGSASGVLEYGIYLAVIVILLIAFVAYFTLKARKNQPAQPPAPPQ